MQMGRLADFPLDSGVDSADNAAMANPEQLEILKKGVVAWNIWRQTNRDVRPDLRDVDLSRENLGKADLRGAEMQFAKLRWANLNKVILDDANLTKADLAEVDLRGALLRNANLTGVNLGGAKLSSADLTGADLTGAVLIAANLSRAQLQGSDFTKAEIGWTVFADSDLRDVKGLENVFHVGPSYIGIEAIYKSAGKISETFLRGAGVPETFLIYMGALVGTVVEFYSCFISYSTKDQEFAERLYADLQAHNVRCWFAPHDIQGGRKIRDQIDEAIRLHDKLLLILSSESTKSFWVETEIAKARKREHRDERRVLFPVRLVDFETLKSWECFDADTGKDFAREIREYFIPDFSDWKNHDSYQTAFQRLLKDLKAG